MDQQELRRTFNTNDATPVNQFEEYTLRRNSTTNRFGQWWYFPISNYIGIVSYVDEKGTSFNPNKFGVYSFCHLYEFNNQSVDKAKGLITKALKFELWLAKHDFKLRYAWKSECYSDVQVIARSGHVRISIANTGYSRIYVPNTILYSPPWNARYVAEYYDDWVTRCNKLLGLLKKYNIRIGLLHPDNIHQLIEVIKPFKDIRNLLSKNPDRYINLTRYTF